MLQNSIVRLWRALGRIQPESVRSFINLAAVQIRRELIDLSRHYNGPYGIGKNHASQAGPVGSESIAGPPDPGTDTGDPSRLATWTEFHDEIDRLPDEEREIFDLLWYQGLSQAEAATLLGVTERSVKYRWRTAKLRLSERLGGRLPE